ncbi:hypothetical protein C7B76_15205 [filamentous cyanobacterium CCP2]|nr:hypothetical protein C7B76_15205 [filamentous cyanobacterium CCP2]
MNFFGLLWVISAISSFIPPHEPPRALEYLSRTLSNRSIALISRVTGSSTSSRPGHSGSSRSSKFSYRSAASSAPPPNPSVNGQVGRLQPTSSKLTIPLFWFSWSRSLTASLQPDFAIQAVMSPVGSSAIAMPSALTGGMPTRGIPSSAPPPAMGLSSSSQVLSSQDLSNPVLQVVSNLFRWSSDVREAFGLAAPLVTIVPAQNPCLVTPSMSHRWSYESRYGIRELRLGQCTELWRRDYSLPEPVQTVYQVRVKDHVVAELTTLEQAEGLARRLQHVLKDSDFDPYNLFPTTINGLPAGRAGDSILFWIEPELATLLDRNAELMAIAWINNLREALHTPTIPLIQAQSQMHRLIPTERKFQGTASWYGPYFHGRLTATGEVFNQNDLTAAHPTLPFNTYLKVTSLATGKTIIVRINDRGPYFEDRSLDLSREAARSLDSEIRGVVPYEAVVMERADLAQVRASRNFVSPLAREQELAQHP